MKLGAKILSERGKPVDKTGNENIQVIFNDEKLKTEYIVDYTVNGLCVRDKEGKILFEEKSKAIFL